MIIKTDLEPHSRLNVCTNKKCKHKMSDEFICPYHLYTFQPLLMLNILFELLIRSRYGY